MLVIKHELAFISFPMTQRFIPYDLLPEPQEYLKRVAYMFQIWLF